MSIAIVTIDGPSGSGKGTVAQGVADALSWGLLDSGAMYRVLALAAVDASTDLASEQALAALAVGLPVRFESAARVILNDRDVSLAIRAHEVSEIASKIAVYASVREALLARQRAFARAPGLVADGRDMGTVVFPEAGLKVFLTASAEVRAQRRYKQLKDKGEDVSLRELLHDIKARDERDSSRSVAPLVPAEDAMMLDSTSLGIAEVLDSVLAEVQQRGLSSNV